MKMYENIVNYIRKNLTLYPIDHIQIPFFIFNLHFLDILTHVWKRGTSMLSKQ